MARMIKISLIAIVAFYFLGVCGFAGAQISREWDGDWSFHIFVLNALEAGLDWPLQIIEHFLPT
jgi:hypothetical protein